MKIVNGMTAESAVRELERRLQKYRLDMNMKQSELSKKSGVSVATIRRMESGGDVSLNNVVAVLLAMGLSSGLDYVVPEETMNPVDLTGLGHSRKRAGAKKKTAEKILWGEPQ